VFFEANMKIINVNQDLRHNMQKLVVMFVVLKVIDIKNYKAYQYRLKTEIIYSFPVHGVTKVPFMAIF